jgi:hypothetical protein
LNNSPSWAMSDSTSPCWHGSADVEHVRFPAYNLSWLTYWMTIWPTNMWQLQSSLNDNNIWWQNITVTKGHHILWQLSILLSQGTFSNGLSVTTFMTVVFVIPFILWQFLYFPWHFQFVIKAQIFCSGAIVMGHMGAKIETKYHLSKPEEV